MFHGKAYSVLDVKSVDETADEYVIKGVASTPRVDRMQDIVEPLGAKFAIPMPLLWQHHSDKPVGRVTFARPTKTAIPYEARLPKVKEAGALRDRIEEAVQSIKYRLVAAVSIGFQAVEDQVERMKDGGLRFKEWEWLELSLVTIPANPEATITSIKSIDTEIRAALGEKNRSGERLANRPGDTGKPPKGTTVKTIKQMQDERDAIAARMKELSEGCAGDPAALSDEDKTAFADLKADLKSVDEAIDFRKTVDMAANGAVEITADVGASQEKGSKARGGFRNTAPKATVPPGTGFTRLAIALMAGKGSESDAIRFAERQGHWKSSTPEVLECLKSNAYQYVMKAAVDVGTTQDTDWAAPLVQFNNLASEFIAMLRPATIVGRIQGFTRVPFNVKMPRETSAAAVGWVGEIAPKPVGKFSYDSVTLLWNKIAVIVAFSDELVRFSNPSIEAVVTTGLIKQIAMFEDEQFINPAVAVNALISPASVTNGSSNTGSTGSTIAQVKADIAALFGYFDTAGLEASAPVFVMRPRTARYLANLMTANDVQAFPGMTATGGTLQGVPVVASGSVPMDTAGLTIIALIDAAEILLADDGGVTLDSSREASINMEDSPTAGAQTLLSLWQNNLVGLKAEHYITWKKRRTTGVAYLTSVAY